MVVAGVAVDGDGEPKVYCGGATVRYGNCFAVYYSGDDAR